MAGIEQKLNYSKRYCENTLNKNFQPTNEQKADGKNRGKILKTSFGFSDFRLQKSRPGSM